MGKQYDQDKVARCMKDYILKDKTLKEVSVENNVPYRTVQRWSSNYKWNFIKNSELSEIQEDLLDMSFQFIDVYKKAYDKVMELLDDEFCDARDLLAIINSLKVVDDRLEYHYKMSEISKTYGIIKGQSL